MPRGRRSTVSPTGSRMTRQQSSRREDMTIVVEFCAPHVRLASRAAAVRRPRRAARTAVRGLAALAALAVVIVAMMLTAEAAPPAATALPDDDTLRDWVAEMKTAPRGPFEQIRWFCADGTVLPPKES